ncbi:MAG: cytochrome b [Gemmobacter sp.]
MPRRHHPLLVALHWLVAGLILGALIGGKFSLDPIPNADPSKVAVLRLHMIVGLTVLTLMLVRVVVRFTTAAPPPADTGAPALDTLRRLAHGLLYLLAFAMPLSGIALARAAGLPEVVFGGTGTLPPSFEPFAARAVHGAIAGLLALVLALHVAAALWHQFVRRDGLFARMWFGPR